MPVECKEEGLQRNATRDLGAIDVIEVAGRDFAGARCTRGGFLMHSRDSRFLGVKIIPRADAESRNSAQLQMKSSSLQSIKDINKVAISCIPYCLLVGWYRDIILAREADLWRCSLAPKCR
jgi:hypothetical protein